MAVKRMLLTPLQIILAAAVLSFPRGSAAATSKANGVPNGAAPGLPISGNAGNPVVPLGAKDDLSIGAPLPGLDSQTAPLQTISESGGAAVPLLPAPVVPSPVMEPNDRAAIEAESARHAAPESANVRPDQQSEGSPEDGGDAKREGPRAQAAAAAGKTGTAVFDGGLGIRSAPSETRLDIDIGDRDMIKEVIPSADGRYQFAASYGPKVFMLDGTGKVIREFVDPLSGKFGLAPHLTTSIKVGPGGHLFVADDTRGIVMWDVQTGKVVRRFRHDTPPRNGAEARAMKYARESRSGREWHPPGLPPGTIAMTLSGNNIISLGFDSTVRVWDIASEKEKLRLEDSGKADELALSGDGKIVFVAPSYDGGKTINGWEVATGRLKYSFEADSDVERMASSPDGRHLFLFEENKRPRRIEMREAGSGRIVREFTDASIPGVRSIVLSPDGKRMFASTGDRITMWDVGTGAVTHYFDWPDHHMVHMSLTTDGRRLIGLDTDKTVRTWEIP